MDAEEFILKEISAVSKLHISFTQLKYLNPELYIQNV
jgi:hypothetical protein